MAILDFTEIAVPTGGPGRDSFELFSREFLHLLGFKILEEPDRGADGGRDLLVEERRVGIAGETTVRWIVSCKHKAHSGAAVSPQDESDIHDRVRTHSALGFIAIYSTVPSTGLAIKLNATGLPFEVCVYDSEKIERHLLSSLDGKKLAERFFPKSIKTWARENPNPASVFGSESKLECKRCGRSLLDKDAMGIVVSWEKHQESDASPVKRHTEAMYWCCKGNCDTALQHLYRRRHPNCLDVWEDIPDLMMPIVFIRWVMSVFNELRDGHTYSDEAFDANKELLLNIFPYACRDLTSEELDRVRGLTMIPSYLGGLGYER